MPSAQKLDQLSTKELHERSFRLARRRLDVRFFWNLLEAAPAVEAAAGHQDEANVDVLSLSERVRDVVNPDSTEEADAFRPIYIDYLSKHEEG
ncbi:MAG: hypothetical protein M3135_00165 [Actinomycetota bacterium]|nr:hypothetical protein [Actinomycetota bacterium]